MHIVLVNSEYPSETGQGQGGIATYTYTMAAAFESLGHDVHIFLRRGVSTDHIPRNCVPVFYDYEPPKMLTQRILRRFRSNPRFWEEGLAKGLRSKLLKLNTHDKIDVVEIPEFGGAGYACTPPLPFPVVINFHMSSSMVDELNGINPDTVRLAHYRFEEKAIKNGTAYRTPSNAVCKDASKRFNIDMSGISVIPNPVSTAPFDAIEKLHSGDVRFHVLFIGRLERRKGAELLCNGIRDILDIDDHIHITIAGETEMHDADGYRNAIERVLDSQQRQRVWFLGSVDRSNLFILYCRSSILLAPSLFENAPYSILEAMSAMLPIVASASGGIPEIITHEQNGLLFENGKAASMVECVRKLYEQRELGIRLAENAYNTIKVTCSPDIIAKRSIAFYESIQCR
ncbi:MAG TPA: glycosyltransferase family 4 protein [Chitinispirillaceae bacterium]|nr:glycosyltransferase family 4 protein [Chitinispirillaceae bacterium]